MKKSIIKEIIKEEIKKVLSENSEQSRQALLRGNQNLLKQNPDLIPYVEAFLINIGKEEMRDLDVDEMSQLNISIITKLNKDKPSKPIPSGPTTPSKGYMGSKYTGD